MTPLLYTVYWIVERKSNDSLVLSDKRKTGLIVSYNFLQIIISLV